MNFYLIALVEHAFYFLLFTHKRAQDNTELHNLCNPNIILQLYHASTQANSITFSIMMCAITVRALEFHPESHATVSPSCLEMPSLHVADNSALGKSLSDEFQSS